MAVTGITASWVHRSLSGCALSSSLSLSLVMRHAAPPQLVSGLMIRRGQRITLHTATNLELGEGGGGVVAGWLITTTSLTLLSTHPPARATPTHHRHHITHHSSLIHHPSSSTTAPPTPTTRRASSHSEYKQAPFSRIIHLHLLPPPIVLSRLVSSRLACQSVNPNPDRYSFGIPQREW
jgi:hypothetical protein